MTNRKKNFLILTGDAGFGHRSAAEAVRKAINIKYGEQSEALIKNPLNHPDIPDIIRESQSNYDTVVKLFPDLYKFGYQISDAKLPVKIMESGFTVLFLDTIRTMVKEISPDIIISTYPIFMAPLQTIFQSDHFNIPLITVITDLITVHRVWFNKGAARCTVPTKEVANLALKAGFREDQVINTGIPVDPQIAALKDADKNMLRTELGWQERLTTILVAGSPRIGSLIEILKSLDSSNQKFQFALVAGKNETLLKKFKSVSWQHPAHIYDFVDTMPKMMRASDMILCKAGGLITTESLASGLPMMVVEVIPGQEEGNLRYILEHEAGVHCKKPKCACNDLEQWLENDRKLLKITAENAAKIGRPDAAFDIADIAWDLVD